MPTVAHTPGASNANSYIPVSDGDTFADERLQASKWTGATADEKARAVIQATRRLDQRTFKGWKTASSQALKWPRTDVLDENGDEYATNAIPALLKRATFETALWLLNQDDAGTDPLAPTGLEQFNRARVGPLDVEPNHGYQAGELPDAIESMIIPLLADGSLGGAACMAEMERM